MLFLLATTIRYRPSYSRLSSNPRLADVDESTLLAVDLSYGRTHMLFQPSYSMLNEGLGVTMAKDTGAPL